MVLARAWQMFQQWRAVEKAGSATVQRALAQRDAAIKMGEEQAKRHAAMATNFADVAEKHVEATRQRGHAAVAERVKVIQEKLEAVKADPSASRQRAMNSLLDKWEETLTSDTLLKAKPPPPSSGGPKE